MEIREYLREIGKRGGSSKSDAKGAAARETLARIRAKRWPVKTDAVAVEGNKASVGNYILDSRKGPKPKSKAAKKRTRKAAKDAKQ